VATLKQIQLGMAVAATLRQLGVSVEIENSAIVGEK